MKKITIYTENKNQKWIEALLSIGFDGFTIIHTKGYWKRIPENGLEIIIYTSNPGLVREFARLIKIHNKQDSVLIDETECKIDFI